MRTSGFAVGFKKEDLQLIEIYTSTITIIWLLDDLTSTENDINDSLQVYLDLQSIDQLCKLTNRCIILFISRRQQLTMLIILYYVKCHMLNIFINWVRMFHVEK